MADGPVGEREENEKKKEKNLIDLGLEPESSDLAGQPTTARLQRQCYQYLIFLKISKGIANQTIVFCCCFFGLVFCF